MSEATLDPAEVARERAIVLSGYGHAVPRPITDEWLDHAEKRGMIRKADLVDGAWYIGCSRAAYMARWEARGGDGTGCFHMLREKRGRFRAESYNHPEDQDGFDVFVPTLMALGPAPS